MWKYTKQHSVAVVNRSKWSRNIFINKDILKVYHNNKVILTGYENNNGSYFIEFEQIGNVNQLTTVKITKTKENLAY